MKKVEGTIKCLNPDAQVIKTCYSKIDLKQILDTNLFDMSKAENSAGWLKSLREEMVPESVEYGIQSFVYRRRQPFHPVRLFELLDTAFLIIENPGTFEGEGEEMDAAEEGKNDQEMDEEEQEEIDETEEGEACDMDIQDSPRFDPEESKRCFEMKSQGVFRSILRSKGFLWIANKDKFMGEWSQAGIILTLSNSGNWLVDMPKEILDMDDEVVKNAVGKDFQEGIGDRRQEIVFIGNYSAEERHDLEAALDGCLMKSGEVIDDEFEDPWDEWV